MLGGAFFVNGNVNPAAEANIFGDAEAADLVLGLCPRCRVVGLDVTHKARPPPLPGPESPQGPACAPLTAERYAVGSSSPSLSAHPPQPPRLTIVACSDSPQTLLGSMFVAVASWGDRRALSYLSGCKGRRRHTTGHRRVHP